MEPLTPRFVEYLHALSPENLGAEVMDRARYLLVDYLGCALRGSIEESSQAVYRTIERSGPCTVIGTHLRSSEEHAALANGAAGHSVELDDTHQEGSIHLGVVMFPAALAVAERLGTVDPDGFFTAVVAGYEAAARIAIAVQPKDHYELGFHPTATCGVFGAAVTAAKLLGLTEEQMVSALGIAGSMSAGLLAFLADGSWTKRLHPGLAASNGIRAARLAQAGFRGPGAVLEGRDGFLYSYSRKPDLEAITDGLGEGFALLHTGVKPHACCRYMQPSIDGLIALVKQHDIQPEAVTRIECTVLAAGWPLVAEPRARKYRPETVVDAQFSMPFGAAVAILYRDAGIDHFNEVNLHCPEVRKLMGRVVLMKDMRIDKYFPKEWRGRVTVYTNDGQEFQGQVRHPKGDPENPLTWDELRTKYRSLVAPVSEPVLPALLDSLRIEV